MTHIPAEPVLSTVLGLCLIAITVLILPFLSKKIEENLEPFFLFLGLLSVTISGLWRWDIVTEALKSPVMTGRVPIGIFQVVLIAGFLIHYFNDSFCRLVMGLVKKLGHKWFIFLLITSFGFLSSIISVIITASLLAETASVLPFTKKNKKQLVVMTCFAAGLGACLTPLGEPLSTILVAKLAGPPYHAGFSFPLKHFGIYIVPGVLGLAIFGAFWLGAKMSSSRKDLAMEDVETAKSIIIRALKVYMFISSLVLLGEGFRPLMVWYLAKIPAGALYWLNTISAVLDNATLTAIEVGPTMSLSQITGITMGLLIAGGMLIPGNIPNIVAAGRLKIKMREWAGLGVPLGLTILCIYFIVLYVL